MNGVKHLITAALMCLSSKGTIQSCCSLLFVFMAAIASAVFSLVGGSILSTKYMNGIKHLITAALKCLSSKGTIQSCCSLLFVFMAAIASAVFSLVGGSILSTKYMNGIKHLITAALKCLSSKGTIQSCCLLLFLFMAAIASAVSYLVGINFYRKVFCC